MQFNNIFEAFKHVKEKTAGIDESSVAQAENGVTNVDPKLFKYFFDLQSKVEKDVAPEDKGMDYHVYAQRMWRDLIGEITPENQEFVTQFENELIARLHKIDMGPLVYDHVTENIATLVEKYADQVKHVALWSTGDVQATGYQVGKITSSEIVRDFHRGIKKHLTREESASFLKEKTSYFVADDKFKALTGYIQNELEKHPDEKIKIIIIEDARKNFEKAEASVKKILEEASSRVEIIPIWASYSREGQQAQAQAESTATQEKFDSEKQNLNAISTFAELTSDARFAPLFAGAHVFVDFDGVIGNNVAMREDQASATYTSLINSATKATGQSEEDLVSSMKARI